ncbi:MAG: phosphatase PAP2 family protein [Chitinophagales bacterium]
MKAFLRENHFFLLMYFLFLVVGGIVLFKYEKGDEIIYFNSLHTSTLNYVFLYLTKLAELPAIILILLITLFYSYGKGLLLLANNLTVFAVVQFLKKVVFAAEVRPSLFFENKLQLDFIPGLLVLKHNSFPSGHTAGAFALFFLLSVMVKDKRWSVLFFFLALLVGVSRVYLLQHFFRDVYAGSIVAMVVSCVFWLTFAQSRFYQNLKWKDKSLFK